MTTPGAGPVTAIAFVATVDRVTRFRDAHQLERSIGLVPRGWSSSETQRKGAITKAGNTRIRWLLAEAAWCILRRRKKAETAQLRDWADQIARRRGSHVAAVALARRLAGILLRSGAMEPSATRGRSDGGARWGKWLELGGAPSR
jgi:transposase